MALQPIEEGIYREIEKDIYIFVMQNQNKTDIAWHETRNTLCKFLLEKGYCKEE